jgi:hypothetical protein
MAVSHKDIYNEMKKAKRRDLQNQNNRNEAKNGSRQHIKRRQKQREERNYIMKKII